MNLSLLFSYHYAATWALVGLIWTIQLVHYPLFAQVGRDTFKAYHHRHTTQITWVVAPLMLTELITAAWLVMTGSRDAWLLVSLLPLVVNWLSTWRVQIPLTTSSLPALMRTRMIVSWRPIGGAPSRGPRGASAF